MKAEEKYISELVMTAKNASYLIKNLSTLEKNHILGILKNLLLERTGQIIEQNKTDLKAGAEKGLSSAMLDRLKMDEKTIAAMAKGVQEIIDLPDPVGKTTPFRLLENGIRIGQASVPLGVVAVIYESRPNVTIDVASLCLKSGNVAILRGGSEAFFTNQALYSILRDSFLKMEIAVGAFFVDKTEREYVNLLLKQDKFIDIVVPRGGYGLIQAVSENSTIPVIKHDAGICHIYLAPDASPDMVEKIVINAKTQRPGVCNALETLLIDQKYPFKKEIFDALKARNVLLKGCAKSREIMPQMEPASEKEYGTEWLDLILSVKIVQDMKEAMEHINKFSSGHSEGIISNDYNLIGEFLNKVDSAALFVNCSTRFHDGGQFGLGAEVGISTQKLHVRGPMGLEHLTCKKYIVLGQGQIRE